MLAALPHQDLVPPSDVNTSALAFGWTGNAFAPHISLARSCKTLLCRTSSSGTSSGSCSAEQQRLACALLAKHNSGALDLATRHPSGVSDNAYAYNNIRDMCNGNQAARSSYSCSTCPSGTPGGSVCLTMNLLNYLTRLVSRGHVIVNELAGACHSCTSRHYNGQAVDLHNDARTREYLDTCE
ncbi:peptidoglycan-binding domain 1 protein [Plakobranchus ocellatus]|uniref:Peptidoglycan-binding domain 1 protein n=1 Tax=Plakobranchus ocellatus TaxID=259542 RepID=A0AAV4DTY4_9GAST|nr:peptidoglycan-binding domain 1 protein [Plakobranchus ocellatus]